jgi:hypothetical protein
MRWQGHMQVVMISNTLFMAIYLYATFVVMIHDRPSYDNTATLQIS